MRLTSSRHLLIFLLLLLPISATADDWPQWRGPNRDNVSHETGLLDSWPDRGPPLLYRVEGLGGGISPPAIVGDRAFTITEFDGHEYVVAFNADTGQRLWLTPLGLQSHEFVSYHVLMRWLSQRMPTVHDGKLYAVTAFGLLVCLAIEDGRPLWSKDFRQEYGVTGQTWGYCDYPLVDGDLLICVPGGAHATVVALDRHTGQEVWRRLMPSALSSTSPKSFQRSAYAATLPGREENVDFFAVTTSEAIHFLSRSDGKPLADFSGIYQTIANSHTGLFHQGDLVVTNGYAGGIARLSLSSTELGIDLVARYQHRAGLDAFHDIGLIARRKLFHVRNGQILMSLDPDTGETLFARRMGSRFAHTYADGHLYCVSVEGLVSLVDVDSVSLETRSSFPLPDIQPARGVTLPVIAHGRLYLRFDNQLFCFDISSELEIDQPDTRLVKHLPPKLDPSLGDRRLPEPIYFPTPSDIVTRMLREVDLKPGQKLVDLGSGDGRIVIEAAKSFGALAVGYEIDEELVAISRTAIAKEQLTAAARIEAVDMYAADLSSVDRLVTTSLARAREAGIAGLVDFKLQDMYTADLQEASVATAYLYPAALNKLKPQFSKMKPGAKIVSHHYAIPDVQPDQVFTCKSKETGDDHKIWLYTVPLMNTANLDP